MLFHTPTFLVFFAVFVACYASASRGRARTCVLLVFSNVFYGWWDWRFLGLLWVTILVDFSLARLIAARSEPAARRALLCLSIGSNLGILGFFKYWNFFVDSALSPLGAGAQGWRIPDLVLPVGISFYVFQSMSYTIDVYRGEQQPIRSLLEFAAFVCYFPQLVAGPIERVGHLLPQLLRPAPITLERVASGAVLFAVGLLRKALGDLLASVNDPILSDLTHADPAQVVFAILSFGFQIYLDFAGYSEMARGMARALGVELKLNFASPYLAASFRDFWRRWHISLSHWLRDYVYFPLGASRHGLLLTLRNLMLTMLLGGLWHGAGWNFVIWGLLHGAYLALDVLWERVAPRRTGVWAAASGLAGWLLTFVGVNYAWLYFRLPTLEQAVVANSKIAEWLHNPTLAVLSWRVVALLAPVLLLDVVQRDFREAFPALELRPLRAAAYGAVAGASFLLGVILLAGQPTQQFIYFQF